MPATARQRLGKAYLTLSRKIYFAVATVGYMPLTFIFEMIEYGVEF